MTEIKCNLLVSKAMYIRPDLEVDALGIAGQSRFYVNEKGAVRASGERGTWVRQRVVTLCPMWFLRSYVLE
ncbi:hypothetical protein [Marilutibacter maris]|uniref:hypothetical protein n=1 Tax=Marilutibacter maris TaxID=1605891 RepID=UPI0011AE89D0|nr:hypothetical protein [Lysobacter maris]